MKELTDTDRMPFGKYVGYKMENIPARYLLWFHSNVPHTFSNLAIHNYIKNNLIALEERSEQEIIKP